MTMNIHNIGLMILSLFCSGGLYAYVREVRRLQRLISSGKVVSATVVKKDKIDAGSETVSHLLVSYTFAGARGKTMVHEQDLNSEKFFNKLNVGDRIGVIYYGNGETSCPQGQIHADLKIAQIICVAITVFWVVTGAILVFMSIGK